jgi:NAD-dependent dihydropyrimidine dehydrogenase PreA subunit
LRHLGGILDGICKGRGTVAHLKQMEDLGWILKNGSLCGLGKTAANPILSVLRYFKDEVDAHVRDRRCPAHVCRALIKFTVDQAKCKACGKCVKACRVDAIAGGRKKTPAAIDQEKCIRCRICYTACPFKAINVD